MSTNSLKYESFIRGIFNGANKQIAREEDPLALANTDFYNSASVGKNIHDINLVKLGMADSIRFYKCNNEDYNKSKEQQLDDLLDEVMDANSCDKIINVIDSFNKEFLTKQ